jgi:flagellar hook-length control protein FliK
MARSLLTFDASSSGGHPVLSAPPAAANAAFQTSPAWLARANTAPGNDLFGHLVSQNTPNGSSAAPAPVSPPPQNSADVWPAHHNNPHAASPPTAHHNNPQADNHSNNPASANNNDNASSSPPANADSDSGANIGPSNSGSNASAPASVDGNSNDSSASANGASQSTTTTSSTDTSGKPKSGDDKPQGSVTGAAIAVDAALLAQQVGNAPVTPTPIAAAIPISAPVTNTPSVPPTSGGPTAPLAIAAAAIAASAQPLSPTIGPSVPGNADSGTSNAGATPTIGPVSAQPTSKVAVVPPVITLNAGVQAGSTATVPDPSVLTTAVGATAPVTPKTAQGTVQAATKEPAANATTADTNATSATADSAQSTTTAQTATTAKLETANLPVQGAATDSASPTPAASNHEHVSNTVAAAHVAADVADPSAQTLGAVQPQLNSASHLVSTSNLTATVATNGAVPLNGLAVEIAANVKSGKSNFEIRLDPADLGRIDVRVQIDQNGQVTSHLTVEKPETLSMLQQDAPQLQQALNDAGLKTDGGGLQFSLRDQASSGQNNANDNNPRAQRLVISDEDGVPAAVAGRSYGRSLGSSGGVDIRV